MRSPAPTADAAAAAAADNAVPRRPSSRSAARPARSAARRLLAVLPALGLLVGLLSAPLPAAAAATVTGTCQDGGGVTWNTKVVWGSPYRSSHGVVRIKVDVAGWTTDQPGTVPTDSVVRSYDGSGKLVRTLRRSASFDYRSGTRWDHRNPGNPTSVPGKSKVTVTTGVDGDGKDSCTTTFVQPGAAATSTPAPSAGPGDTTPGWLSGASSAQAADGSYGAWRGSPVEIVGFWVNDPALYPIGANIPGCGDCGAVKDWAGPIDMAVAPPTWSSWANEANGEHDAFWTAIFRNAKTLRAGKGTTYIRPWYEYNGDWMPYSVRPGEEAAFKQAFTRINAIQDREYPASRLALGVSAGGPVSIADTWPSSGVDVLNIDFYNNWPFCTTTACFNNKIANGGGASSLSVLQRLARTKGVPVAIGEWSNQGERRSDSSGGGGESPGFMRDWNSWLRANAGTDPGQVLYEVQFNLWPDQFELFTADKRTTPLQPQTAAEYRRLW